ncbi:MAG: GNAT family N-acetyltransferase [Gammaproteobacteria bacterium]|nr:GNAT family N-acetyltransferase [Gammaproteobacteria bacterium]
MQKPIQFQVIPAQRLSQADLQSIQDLCTRAYGEDVWCDYEYLKAAYHVVGRDAGVIVSHALWVNRSLSVNCAAPLMTAYVEYVATEPTLQGQGLASQLLRFLLNYIQNQEAIHAELDFAPPYQLAALAPAESQFYERLGWELWQGDLYIRQQGDLIPTPDDDVMIFRLTTTPEISTTDDLSAEWREGELW